MQGQILVYSSAVNSGLITGEDGKNYSFTVHQWLSPGNPANDQFVAFNPAGCMAESVRIIEKKKYG